MKFLSGLQMPEKSTLPSDVRGVAAVDCWPEAGAIAPAAIAPAAIAVSRRRATCIGLILSLCERWRSRRLLQHPVDDFLELVRGQQIFFLEGFGLHLLKHGHPFFIGGLDAELLAPFFHRGRPAVLAEHDGHGS